MIHGYPTSAAEFGASRRQLPTGAAFFDFANLHAAFHDAMNQEQAYRQYNGRHPRLFSPRQLVDALQERFGPFALAKAYANWNFFVLYLDDVRNAAVEPVFSNDRYEKNTDRVLTADAVEAACTLAPLDFIVIGSGDGDFVPLAQKLRSRKVKVYGVGVAGSVSRELRDACDQYVTLTSTGSWPAAVAKFGGGGWPRYSPAAPALNGYAGGGRNQ